MARITTRAWNNYIGSLRRVSERASKEMLAMVMKLSNQYSEGIITLEEYENAVIDYAYALATKYGEAAGAAACEMYDAIAELQGANVPPAVPAETATMAETAKAVKGTMKTGNVNIVADATGRLVKLVGVDTMQQNALRDGAEWAWIPMGDTCAFCLTLASRGWQKASKNAIKNGHAEHVHANCDCTYAVRFNDSLNVQGYDPDKYLDMYYDADGSTPQERINALRREFYDKNKKIINQQKRSAYARRTALNGSSAEEINISAIKDFENVHWKDASETGLLIKKDGTHISLGGEEHNVIGDKNLLGEMDGATFSHNHPSNTTFSTTDIANGIARGNLREMRAVTSSGDIHILKNDGASAENRRKFNALYSEAEKKFTRIANEKYRRGELTDRAAYINERKEKWLAENAPKYGLEYRKTHR